MYIHSLANREIMTNKESLYNWLEREFFIKEIQFENILILFINIIKN